MKTDEANRLYLVHCGFYDDEVGHGVYESHINFFVAARSFEEAKKKAKTHPDFLEKKMHVDGLQEIEAVDGCRVTLVEDPEAEGRTVLKVKSYADLNP